jgi:glc operon protein GlcG
MTSHTPGDSIVLANVRFQRLFDVAKAVLDRCVETGLDCTVVAVDASGHVVVTFRTDHAPFITLEPARRKAVTAAGMRIHTKMLSEMVLMDPIMADVIHVMDGALAVPGGFPIFLDGTCIGGVGIAAAHYSEDHAIGTWVLNAGDRT